MSGADSNVSNIGLSRVEGRSDPDDYVDIESGGCGHDYVHVYIIQNSLCRMSYSLWYVKIDPFQNQNLSTSLERPYKKLLNACFSFEICLSKHSYTRKFLCTCSQYQPLLAMV